MTIIIHPAIAVLIVVAATTVSLARLWRRPTAPAPRRPHPKRQRYAEERTLTEDRFVTKHGYVMVKADGHPLARSNGYIMEHRKVLFDAIGAGEHPCRWCSEPVEWRPGVVGAKYLMVDHVDGDKQNNALGNLAVSCSSCNSARSAPLVDVIDGESLEDRNRRRNRERQAKHRARKRAALSDFQPQAPHLSGAPFVGIEPADEFDAGSVGVDVADAAPVD